MGLIPWRKGNGSGKKKGPKTINIFVGFFFVVNYCLGTGFLGIPYAFFYSGYLAALPVLLFISVVSWVNANYLLEVMARAQALETHNKMQHPAESDTTTDSEAETRRLASTYLNGSCNATKKDPPKFEITVRRKFEIAELCEVFVNKYLKFAYLVLIGIFGFLACWSFATVAGSAWAINIPFRNFGAAEKCSEDAFLHNVIPSGGCLYAYYFSLTMFALIVVTLSLFDLKEQALVQLVLGVLRFVTVGAILVYCIVRLARGGDPCADVLQDKGEEGEWANFSANNIGLRETVVRFDIKGLVVAIPVFSFAFLFHTGISSLTHPIKQKRYLHWLLVIMFVASTLAYTSLGVLVPLWFRASIQETCTLNWALFTHHSHSPALRALSYYLVLFPTIDVISAYPLTNHVVVNNLYILITGHDSSKRSKYKFDLVLRVALRLAVAIVPILAAFGVANLIYVLKYAGLLGFMCYFFPVILQLRSIYVCKKTFSTSYFSVSGPPAEQKGSEAKEKDDDVARKSGEISPVLEKQSSSLLFARDLDREEKRALYMTPYSVLFFSHPVAVCVVGVVGLALFLLAFSSLFVHPDRMACDSPTHHQII